MTIDMSFITDDFLLDSEPAKKLYHDYASRLSIIDYHNHLPPEAIANNKSYGNISELWLSDDHYKWRAMRTLGISEDYITGNATPKEKFGKYAACLPYLIRNPIYHWSHLELLRYFGISDLLNDKNANSIYDQTSELLQQKENSTKGLLKKMNVEFVCTTESPIDNLEHHKQIKDSSFEVEVSTAFRPDLFISIDSHTFLDSLSFLEKSSNLSIKSFQDLKDALLSRIIYFHENGCRISDHGLNFIPFKPASDALIQQIFNKRLKDEHLSQLEVQQYRTIILLFLSREYHRLGWVQQFHLGAYRNANAKMYKLMGKDKGWDSIGNYTNVESLMSFFDQLNKSDQLTKTILYNCNPADNSVMASLIGNFNNSTVCGRVQWGASWWFLDQIDGIKNHLNTLSSIGVLSTFVGMLTDSRSFLSFVRHEYFRRILCNLLGEDILRSRLPQDYDLIGTIVEDICYFNAKNYFNA